MFESKARIQMIASLSVSDLTFNQLKKICQCTNSNMTTHTTKLIESGFIEKKKEFISDKPQTTYHLTTNRLNSSLIFINKKLNSIYRI